MRSMITTIALAAAAVVAPAAGSLAPAASQDFSITNTVEPQNARRRDLMRQLQAWWDVHAYYPRRAADAEEGGTVKLRLLIRPDGNVWMIDVVEGSGSAPLDAAAATAFRKGFVRPLPSGTADTSIDLAVHYVPTRRAGRATPGPARRPFTITSDPVTSPILETMLQRVCSGSVSKQGIRNHPAYGVRNAAEAIFFRRPDGTPWVRFYEGGFGTLAPVVEVGRIVKWSGRKEYLRGGASSFTEYTAWAETPDSLNGSIEIVFSAEAKANQDINRGGTIALSCTTQTVPAVTWSASDVTPIPSPAGDPP